MTRGRGVLIRNILLPSLPPTPARFIYHLPHGSTVEVQYRESFGTEMLIHGRYEAAEIAAVCAEVRPGTTAIDVGANMGLYTLELAAALGPAGQCVSFEPNPGTAERLRGNLARNGIGNVDVRGEAVGAIDGSVTLNISADDALSSITLAPRDQSGSVMVRLTRLDTVWRELRSPEVSVVKIDVEGGEYDVLLGSDALLTAQHPAILTEAWTGKDMKQLSDHLASYGYVATQPVGFETRNVLFVWRE